MKKQFALHTEPHVAEIGADLRLEFTPEVMGDDFLDAYEDLRGKLAATNIDLNNLASVDPAKLRYTYRALRAFLGKLMLPASAEIFARWDVRTGDKTVATYHSPDEAEEHAEGLNSAGGVDVAEVVDAGVRLPDRVLIGLLEWVMELYGGGRPPTSSSASATTSPPVGRSGTARSRSRASTSTGGR